MKPTTATNTARIERLLAKLFSLEQQLEDLKTTIDPLLPARTQFPIRIGQFVLEDRPFETMRYVSKDGSDYLPSDTVIRGNESASC